MVAPATHYKVGKYISFGSCSCWSCSTKTPQPTKDIKNSGGISSSHAPKKISCFPFPSWLRGVVMEHGLAEWTGRGQSAAVYAAVGPQGPGWGVNSISWVRKCVRRSGAAWERNALCGQSSEETGRRQAEGQARCNSAHIKRIHSVSKNIIPHVRKRDLCIVPLQD